MNPSDILGILKEEAVPACGCTEPVAVALATAHAINLIKGEPIKIKVKVSSNIYKNAKAVGIPGTTYTGVKMAAALGVSISNPTYDLTILSSLSKEDVDKALHILEVVPIEIKVIYDSPSVYIDVEVTTEKGTGKVLIVDRHTNIVLLQRENEIVLDKRKSKDGISKKSKNLTNYTLKELLDKVLTLPVTSLNFLKEGAILNMNMAEAGLKTEGGLAIGNSWDKLCKKNLLSGDISNEISYYTAIACDARMKGIQLPVMTTCGSGNHGLIATIPVVIAAKKLKSTDEELIKALAISQLVTIYIKEFTGRLSPVCGCGVAAGAGASAGIVFLLGGDIESINSSIINVVSSLAGMICDGGKVGCALKLYASAAMAWQCALLAKEGVKVPAGNGIVAPSLEETLKNLGKISREGMAQVDKSIISILKS